MSHLSDTQLHDLEQSLHREHQELEHHFDRQLDDSLSNSTGELSSYDNHPADVGTETFERSRDMALDDTQRQRMADIEAALERISQGTYGHCTVCDQPIPYERLAAIPYTEYCTEHAESIHQGLNLDNRPVEEELITPPPARPDEVGWEKSGKFDDADAWRSVEQYGNADSPAMSARRNAGSYDTMLPDKDEN